LWIADARGGVICINSKGEQKLIKNESESKDVLDDRVVEDQPNGMPFDKDGNILIANFGKGCLETLDIHTGKRQVRLDNINGKPSGKVNFVLRDSKDRIYVTISTRHLDWDKAISPNVKDGYIILLD
jgi:gluconolactonase